MKKHLLFAVAFFLGTEIATARSLAPDVRLQLREIPVSGQLLRPVLANVAVYSHGEVVRNGKTIAKLDAYTMDRVNRLIERAREGVIVRSPITARCFVAPDRTARLTADNGTVLLKKGHICLSVFENNTRAGKRLAVFLEKLRSMQTFGEVHLD